MKTQNRTVCLLVLSAIAFVTVSTRAQADFTFGEPVNLGPTVNSTSLDGTPNISTDGLKMYFQSTRPGGLGYEDLWFTIRQTIDDPWGPPVNLASVNSQYREAYPSISADGLMLYFSDYFYGPDRPGGQGGHDLWMTSRASLHDSWDPPVNLGPAINSSAQEVSASVSNDGLVMVFASNRAGGSGNYDLWMSTRPDKKENWGPPLNLGPVVNSSGFDYECCLSCDGLVLLFMSDRAGGLGGSDAWMTVRKSVNDPWGPPVNLGPPVNTSAEDGNIVISADGRMLYFASTRLGGLGGWDIWEAPIVPIVDFDGDGMVAIEDLVRLIESWGEHDPVVDIGPGPWGDGTVDAADLEMLMSYWEQEVDDPTLLAHWALDETEGDVAYDSASQNDAIVVGVPLWQPAGGRIGGALEFDGATLVIADTVVNPADGPFSVFAWIRGGGPGQVVLAQEGGANWLAADAATGALMTELRGSGRDSRMLSSQMSMTDSDWHRIGFAWDGTNRSLYVDGMLVAKDTQAGGLQNMSGGLNIGCGKDTAFGSFWTGLIDDVRIYSRAIQPTAR